MMVKTTLLLITHFSTGTQILKELKVWRSATPLTATLEPINRAQPGAANGLGNYNSAMWTGMEANPDQGHPPTAEQQADSFLEWGLNWLPFWGGPLYQKKNKKKTTGLENPL
jgi:hypothetical protein